MAAFLWKFGKGLDVSRYSENTLGHLLEGRGFRQLADCELTRLLGELVFGQKLVQIAVAVVIPRLVREAVGGGFGFRRRNRHHFAERTEDGFDFLAEVFDQIGPEGMFR